MKKAKDATVYLNICQVQDELEFEEQNSYIRMLEIHPRQNQKSTYLYIFLSISVQKKKQQINWIIQLWLNKWYAFW